MDQGEARLSGRRDSRRHLLLLGTSLSGLLAAGSAPAAPAPFSPAWYAIKGANGPAASAAIANAVAGAGMNSRAYAQVQRSLANLQRSAAAIAAIQSVQSEARALAAPGSVPDGLQPGGIVPSSGLAAPGTAAPVADWTGAATPVQSGPAAAPTVTIRQTASSAFLNWRTLNVGAHTTLNFDQSAGGGAAPTWVALNRVQDPNLQPTQILGHVTAQGHVILVNGSGILFSTTAQVTVGSLIASTAAISDAQFSANGIYSADSRTPSFTGAVAPVIVEPGAQIATSAPLTATSAGGGVILLGSTVTNGGSIRTPDGQTILAAGRDFILQQGYGVAGTGNPAALQGASGLVGNLASTAGFGGAGTVVETVQGSAVAVADGGGTATNTGLIEASTGDVTMVGETVRQAGDILATTSVSTRGTIHLLTDQGDPASGVVLAPGSVTTILPDPDSLTALDAQRATDVTNSANADIDRFTNAPPLNDQPVLPDNQYQSLIQVVSGNSVDIGAGALALSEGGQIQIAAPGRVLIETGAQLDVSGAVGVSLPMSANQVAVNVQGFELRDNPLNRDTGALNNATVDLDTRTLVTAPADAAYANSPYTDTARLYSPSGLFEVSGEVSNISHTIGEWVSAGGTILISGGASGQVVAQPGSAFNLAGGSIDYQAGTLGVTWLIGPGGRLYNAATAPSNLVYSGVYTGFEVGHPRWNITQTYNDPGVTPASVQMPGYVEGRDGGVLEISEPTAVLEGTISAGVITGPLQTQPHVAETDPYTAPQNTAPLAGQLLIGQYSGLGYGSQGISGGFDTAVTFEAGGAPLAASLGLTDPLPAARVNTAVLDTNELDSAGLGAISVATAGPIVVNAPLRLSAAGALTLNGATVALDANVSAPSGTVALGDVLQLPAQFGNAASGFSLVPAATSGGVTAQVAPASVQVGPGVSIDLRGTWTNLLADPVDVAGEATRAGGSLSVDTTGAIMLGAGSVVDVSSGAVVAASGALGGGTGGSVTLIGDDPRGNPAFDAGIGAGTAPVALLGTIRGYGVTGGGTFTLRAPAVAIDAAAPPTGLDASGRTVLTPGAFRAGFDSYVVDGYGSLPATQAPGGATGAFLPGVEVSEGVAVAPVTPVYLETSASLAAPTGSDPETSASLWLPPLYLQDQDAASLTPRAGASVTFDSITNSPVVGSNATELLQGGGAISIDHGASVTVDPGQSIRLEALGQITVDGALTAPGGGSGAAGGITIQNDRYEPGPTSTTLEYQPGLSIWIGSDAVLSTRAHAVSAVDRYGRAYGLAPAGGTIAIGGEADASGASSAVSTDASVVIRPGAVLDASGSATTIDLSAGSGFGATSDRVPLAGAGGSISLNSTSAIAIDGTLRAFAGGPSAAGGSLTVDLVAPIYGSTPVNGSDVLAYAVPEPLLRQREILITQDTVAADLPPDLQPGDARLGGIVGTAQLSAGEVSSGGFDNLTLAGNEFAHFGPQDVRFVGNVTLKTGQSIDLPAILTDADPNARVVIASPYVTLNGNALTSGFISISPQQSWAPSSEASSSTLLVTARQLAIGTGSIDGVDVAAGSLPTTGSPVVAAAFDEPGFASAALVAGGDVAVGGTFSAGRLLSITAAQLYPTTSVAVINLLGDANTAAGTSTGATATPGTLIIARTPGSVPAPPLSVGNSLTLLAGTIEQGGVIEAPLGTIVLGLGSNTSDLQQPANAFTDRVEFLPGSITSVSASGQAILYGGTQDGVTYTVDGGSASLSTPSITVASQSVAIDAGSTVDLNGGGAVMGAGFNSGRGGSTDVLTTPFLQIEGSSAQPAPDEVYAIVPGISATTQPAPAVALAGAGQAAPAAGETVTLATGVPGLPAGTYTLQPSYDALLPGAFRVEIETGTHPLAGSVGAVGNLSTQVTGTIGTAGTPIGGTQPVGVLLTPGAAVRRLSSYDEENYASFQVAQAQEFDYRRGYIPADAGTLALDYDLPIPTAVIASPALAVSGHVLLQAAEGGYGGSATVQTGDGGGQTYFSALEIVGDGAVGQAPAGSVVIAASALDRLNASTLLIGGTETIPTGAVSATGINAGLISFASGAANVTVADGATLSAPQVFLLASNDVTVQSGGSVDTLASGGVPFDSSDGFRFTNILQTTSATNSGPALLAVSNGVLDFIAPGTGNSNPNLVTIENGATLAAQGTIGIETGGIVTIGDEATFAARRLSFAVSSINVIGGGALQAGAVVPSGLDLTQARLDGFETGGVVPGAPALQQISLLATNSINFFGNVSLSLASGSGQTLELQTPSIYGAGGAGDVATIRTGTFIWNGLAAATSNSNVSAVTYVPQPAAPVYADGPGAGSGGLVVDATDIVLGYGPTDFVLAPAPSGGRPRLGRTLYGFSSVSLNATDSVTANNSGTLSVYQSQGAYADGSYANSGGNLAITTPLLTSQAGAVLQITAGGTVSIAGGAGIAGGAAAGLGGEIDVSGASIDLSTSVVLPEGKLALTAAGDIAIGAGAAIDLAGRTSVFFDQSAVGPGGVLTAESTNGSVIADPASMIDVSSPGGLGGSIDITADAGNVSLAGTLLGGGGTPGSVDIRAGTLSDFGGLNQRLTEGGVTGSRGFEIGSGDLTVTAADELIASNIDLALDTGSLTVDGLIDASGAAPGRISLSAGGDLTLTSRAVLDAHGTLAQTDSLGATIDSENRGVVTLRVADGPDGSNNAASAGQTLTIAPGATIDVSAAAGVGCATGPCGDVEIDVPRLGSTDGTYGDLAISAIGPIRIAGAGTVAVNGFWSYAPADGIITQTNSGTGADPNGIGLDQIDAANRAFIASALPGGFLNPTLSGKLAGLTAYASAFHLRPGVEIDSSVASGGNLTVEGDLDLSGLRYASLNASSQLSSAYGSGEPGVLVLRAANNLALYGSITDGFEAPIDNAAAQNPDDDGWVLLSTLESGANLDQSVIVPPGAGTLDIGGSTFAPSGSVNYDLPVAGGQFLADGTTLPTSFTLASTLTVPPGGIVAAGDVIATDGKTILFSKGSVIAGGTELAAGVTLAAGFVLFSNTSFDGINGVTGATQTWPAGASLTPFNVGSQVSVQLASSVPLAAGDVVPVGTDLTFADFEPFAPLRPIGTLPNGLVGQGEVYAAANLLPAGSLSWSITLAAGANMASSEPTRLTPATELASSGATGNLTLSDLHYEEILNPGTVAGLDASPIAYLPSFSVVRTGTGSLVLAAGGSIDEATSYGIYTAGAQSPGVTGTAFDQRSDVSVFDDTDFTSTAQAAVYAGIDNSYPAGGGDVAVAAQSNLLTTFLNSYSQASQTTTATGQWLELQGEDQAANPAAWFVNFGDYLPVTGSASGVVAGAAPLLVGFTGIGTLGGGNLTVTVGGQAGSSSGFVAGSGPSGFIPNAGSLSFSYEHTSSLYVAVGGSGRETSNGLVQTGGGRLSLEVGGELDPTSNAASSGADSVILSLRGPVTVDAGSISSVNGQNFAGSPVNDPYTANIVDGPEIDLGDARASVYTRGDLSLGTSNDPGRQSTFYVAPDGSTTWFSLWQPTTGISLYSAGGDVSPATVIGSQQGGAATYFPPSLEVVAASGSIYDLSSSVSANLGLQIETAPSASGNIGLLAAQSIVADNVVGSSTVYGPSIDMSGADPSMLPSISNPAFSGGGGTVASNTTASVDSLFAFSTDTTTGLLHANDPAPIRFYAAAGDIEGLSTGQIIGGTQYIGAKAVQIRAGDDVVDLNRVAGTGLIFNNNPTDISVIQAGQNIFYANAQVAGPGVLEVSAGGNIDQTDTGTTTAPDPSTLVSLGYLVDKTVATQNAGAGITVMAGVPQGAIDLARFAQLYFDPANVADAATPLQSQPGRVVRTYQNQLLAFLQARGYTGTASGALAAFLALPADIQQILVLQTYYAELNQSGLDYADPSSRFYHSYLEGTEAIHALFPATDLTGRAAASGGSLTLTGDSGITTEFGGGIEIADPFGATTVGVPGPVPGSSSGIITQGQGDVDVYSYGSVLLGQSRIFTTFGGNLLIWLEGDGEINGGQGSKSTIVFTPPNITYDPYADIALAPTVPSTGAGLATLAPVAGVAQGNINLISPFGTIDAGEAGIRSSGNINLVALTVVNAANVQAGGKVTGVTVTAAPNTAGITAASAAAGAVQSAAKNNIGTTAPQQTPSIITVEAVGQGTSQGSSQGGSGSSDDDRRRHTGNKNDNHKSKT